MLNLEGPIGKLQFEEDPSSLPIRDLFRQAEYLRARVALFNSPSDNYYSAIDFTGLQSIGGDSRPYHTSEEEEGHKADIALLRRTCAALTGKQDLDTAIRKMAEEDFENPKIKPEKKLAGREQFVSRRIRDFYGETLKDLLSYMPKT